MSQDAAILTLRSDLIRQRIRMGDRFVWVLKDPLSRAFFYFSDRDFTILQLLNGRRKVAEIISACREKFAPDYVSAESLVAFLADAKSNGLITSSASLTVEELRQRKPSVASNGWKNPLAMRLPGVNPDPMLQRMTPFLKSFFSPWSVGVTIGFAMIACLVVIVNFDQLISQIGAASSRSSYAWILILAIVISTTKVIHELAHGVACKAFGSECRELGIMLLVGIPCLYCDVSDAWMLKSRWKRIIISSAGMLSELLVATIATLLWMSSNDGIVRDICLTTMIVCSVSTVLFNGNPLLRYDGYFILSDLLRIPNLASESSRLIHRTLREKLWALPNNYVGADAGLENRRGTLYLYGLLSGTYRLLVLALISLIIYRFAEGYGLGLVGAALAITLMATTIWRMTKPVVTAPTAAESRSLVSSRRPLGVLVGCGLCAGLILLVPLPQSVTAPTIVNAVGAVDVYLETPGRLVDSIAADANVDAGAPLATFRNHEMELELVRLVSARDRLETQLATLRQSRSRDKDSASKIPAVTKALDSAKKMYASKQREASRLIVKAPRPGKVFGPRNRTRTSDMNPSGIETWTDTPLSTDSRGAVFEEGTLLCSVGDPERREAIVLVRQQEIALIRKGQSVDLLTRTHQRGHFSGVVKEVATSPIDSAAREFFAAGLVDVNPYSSRSGQTRNTYYQVRVLLAATEHAPLVRSTAKARISVAPSSLAARLLRFLSDSFRFSA